MNDINLTLKKYRLEYSEKEIDALINDTEEFIKTIRNFIEG